MTDEPQPEKKLVVDEDWKSQVEAEKEFARRQEQQERQPTEKTGREPLPTPDLIFLVNTLYYQAMVSLGLMPSLTTGKSQVDLEYARYTIDTIQMLWDKTEGNRTPEESATLDAMLHELRMAYLAIEERARTI
jgi:hypothetical protein